MKYVNETREHFGNLQPGLKLQGFTILQKLSRRDDELLLPYVDNRNFVYLARPDSDNLPSVVALKIFCAESEHDQVRPVGLVNEVRALRQLKGEPNVPHFHGEYISASPGLDMVSFLPLDVMPGSRLQDFKPESVGEALRLVYSFAVVMERIHYNQVLHRDLHPGNMIVSPDNRAYVIDFEKSSSMNNANGSGRTNIDSGITFNHLSPEERRREIVDRKSDVYSLGCVALYLLENLFPEIPPSNGQFDVLDQSDCLLGLKLNGIPEGQLRNTLTGMVAIRRDRIPDFGVARVNLEALLN